MLEGIRVMEIGQVLAAPYAACILGDLGAEVIKIEKPQGGDEGRRMGPAYRGQDSMQFIEVNRNKHSVVLDFKTPEGSEQLHALLATADILVHNLRPGIAEECGLDAQTLSARYPKLIYCEISGFGDRGPLSQLGGFEPTAQAFSGLISVNGHPDSPPARVGASVIDYGTAMWIVIGAISALYRRTQTGKGGVVTGALLETALTFVGPHIAAYLNQGREPRRLGTGNPMLVPYQAFAASDGDILIAAGNDRLFEKLSRALGHPEWPKDERFGLTSQFRRAAVSVPSALAEGHARASTREFAHYVSIALGSLAELETQLFISVRLGFTSEEECDRLLARADEIGKMLRGLQKALVNKVSTQPRSRPRP